MNDEQLVQEWLLQGRAVLIVTNYGHPGFTAIRLVEAPQIDSSLVDGVESDDCPATAVRRLMGGRS